MLRKPPFLFFIIISMLAVIQGTALSQEKAPSFSIQLKTVTKQLKIMDRSLKHQRMTTGTLESFEKDVLSITTFATDCGTKTKEALKKLGEDIAKLGKFVKGEARDVTIKRQSLLKEKKSLEKRQSNCNLVLLKATELKTAITQKQKDLLAQRLFARGPDIFALSAYIVKNPTEWTKAAWTFLSENSGLKILKAGNIQVLILLLLLALFIGYFARKHLSHWIGQINWRENTSSHFVRALLETISRYSIQLLLGFVSAMFFLAISHKISPTPFITVLANGIFIYIALISLVFLFLSPRAGYTSLPAETAQSISRRIRVLLFLILIGYLMFTTLLEASLPEEAFQFIRGIYALFLVVNLSWIALLLGKIPRFANTRWIRTVFILTLAVILLSEWLGYRNLSLTVLRIVFGGLLIISAFMLLNLLASEFFDNLDSGKQSWSIQAKKLLGLNPRIHIPGLTWMRVITSLTIWISMIVTLMFAWGMSASFKQQLYNLFMQGFSAGNFKIIPFRIILALITLSVMLTIIGWFKSRLEHHWLAKTQMDRGKREAMTIMSGYIGATVAILISLGIAGVKFGNLALIAGALSVGIGFGLQNVVNNFVSGLIMLFERPMKTGDWVVVGDTEGYIKKIRIRSTVIQTFDKADVIVPNSELISKQVTNWMLHDSRGRARIPVGVAYGTDGELVREILLGIANQHPAVITAIPALQPRVLFREFGDNSLNFELRIHIQNIDDRLNVVSDVNYAIDKQFRENNIEIAYPQRDIHIRDINWGDIGNALQNSKDKNDK